MYAEALRGSVGNGIRNVVGDAQQAKKSEGAAEEDDRNSNKSFSKTPPKRRTVLNRRDSGPLNPVQLKFRQNIAGEARKTKPIQSTSRLSGTHEK